MHALITAKRVSLSLYNAGTAGGSTHERHVMTALYYDETDTWNTPVRAINDREKEKENIALQRKSVWPNPRIDTCVCCCAAGRGGRRVGGEGGKVGRWQEVKGRGAGSGTETERGHT